MYRNILSHTNFSATSTTFSNVCSGGVPHVRVSVRFLDPPRCYRATSCGASRFVGGASQGSFVRLVRGRIALTDRARVAVDP